MKYKTILHLVLFTLMGLNCKGQDSLRINDSLLVPYIDFDFKPISTESMIFEFPNQDSLQALQDIDSNSIRIYLKGGFTILPDSSKTEEYDPTKYNRDLSFSAQFNLEYIRLGCVQSGHEESYNRIIFEHLDQKHGTAWHKEVRKDAIGLSNYLEEKHQKKPKQ